MGLGEGFDSDKVTVNSLDSVKVTPLVTRSLLVKRLWLMQCMLMWKRVIYYILMVAWARLKNRWLGTTAKVSVWQPDSRSQIMLSLKSFMSRVFWSKAFLLERCATCSTPYIGLDRKWLSSSIKVYTSILVTENHQSVQLYKDFVAETVKNNLCIIKVQIFV